MTWDLRDRTVLITGAARGIGAESARQLRAKGARLALAGLEPDLLAVQARHERDERHGEDPQNEEAGSTGCDVNGGPRADDEKKQDHGPNVNQQARLGLGMHLLRRQVLLAQVTFVEAIVGSIDYQVRAVVYAVPPPAGRAPH